VETGRSRGNLKAISRRIGGVLIAQPLPLTANGSADASPYSGEHRTIHFVHSEKCLPSDESDSQVQPWSC
jgi:hypothetical protein